MMKVFLKYLIANISVIFPNEKEIFCIGGYNNFIILSIITPTGINYAAYISAISLLIQELTAGNYLAFHHREFAGGIRNSYGANQTSLEKLSMLMLHDEMHMLYPKEKEYHKYVSLPPYVQKLFHQHCLHVQEIGWRNGGLLGQLFDFLFRYDNGWLKLDLLTKLFPSLRKITLTNIEINEQLIR
eukprot:362247_1